jgi:hypothetical protein
LKTFRYHWQMMLTAQKDLHKGAWALRVRTLWRITCCAQGRIEQKLSERQGPTAQHLEKAKEELAKTKAHVSEAEAHKADAHKAKADAEKERAKEVVL